MYLTFEKYIELGGELTNSEFVLLEWNIRKEIDLITFNRIKNDLEIGSIPYSEDLELLVFSLIPTFSKLETVTSTKPIEKSVSNNGVSVSYASDMTESTQGIAMLKSNCINQIRTALQGIVDSTGQCLIYTGV